MASPSEKSSPGRPFRSQMQRCHRPSFPAPPPLPGLPKMEAGGERGDPLPRLRRHLRQGAEPRALPLQPPLRAGGTAEECAAVEKKKKPSPRLNIHSAFWILASIAVTYYFDFLKSVKEAIQADSWWFVTGSCLLAACLSVAFYCIIYLEWYRGIEDYDVRYPILIPISTTTFIAAAICFNVALWPVWSFMTPLLLFIQFMGVVMLVSLLG
uniref:Transmembrane protein 128 n=1 Tax=Anser brachyrhynchus TaxID=132585 RepID=A0A8B9BAN3_9AVES